MPVFNLTALAKITCCSITAALEHNCRLAGLSLGEGREKCAAESTRHHRPHRGKWYFASAAVVVERVSLFLFANPLHPSHFPFQHVLQRL
jgi:hypothetical protein